MRAMSVDGAHVRLAQARPEDVDQVMLAYLPNMLSYAAAPQP